MLKEQTDSYIEKYLEYRGINFKEIRAKTGFPVDKAIESLGISDKKTIEDYLFDIDGLFSYINRYERFIDVDSYNKRYEDHKNSETFKKSIETIDQAGNLEEALAKKAQIIDVPNKIICEAMTDIMDNTKSGQTILPLERDFVRLHTNWVQKLSKEQSGD